MNRKLCRYVDHICDKMKLPRKSREILKECESKAHAKRTIRKMKENFDLSFEPSVMRKVNMVLTELLEKEVLDGMA